VAGVLEDALVVPCSVTYERLIEGSFARQLCGEPKKTESMVHVLWSMLVALLPPGYGHVQMQFAAPVSLKVR